MLQQQLAAAERKLADKQLELSVVVENKHTQESQWKAEKKALEKRLQQHDANKQRTSVPQLHRAGTSDASRATSTIAGEQVQ